MTELALATRGVPMIEDVTMVADSPAAMVTAQRGLILWCEQKIGACDAERTEALGNSARAKQEGWAGEEKRWKRVAGRERRKIEFYSKVKMALEAGYYIVPPFDGQVFAIRTKRYSPSSHRNFHSRVNSSDHAQDEQTLPAGQGEWRNPHPDIENGDHRFTGKDGKEIVKNWSRAIGWLPMEFPIRLVKPEILAATNSALAGKFFDRLSVLPRFRSPDPIVMGEINMPHKPGQSVAFFVAWWLDTKTL